MDDLLWQLHEAGKYAWGMHGSLSSEARSFAEDSSNICLLTWAETRIQTNLVGNLQHDERFIPSKLESIAEL